MELVSEAIAFAVKAHDGMRRKKSSVPYILHPMEAAVIVGVPWYKRMLRILFPIQKSSFLSGYLLPMVSCMRELSLFVLLVPTSNTLLTTMLMQYSEKGWAQFGNAINLMIIVVVLLVNFTVNKLTGASIDKGVGG